MQSRFRTSFSWILVIVCNGFLKNASAHSTREQVILLLIRFSHSESTTKIEFNTLFFTIYTPFLFYSVWVYGQAPIQSSLSSNSGQSAIFKLTSVLFKINMFRYCIERYSMDIIYDKVMHLDKIYKINVSDHWIKPMFARKWPTGLTHFLVENSLFPRTGSRGNTLLKRWWNYA